MLPVFFAGWPLLLLPTHIVFLELIIDPSCSLVFEAENAEADIMLRPPRDAGERLFSLKAIGLALLQGATALAACVAVYLVARPGHGDAVARALTFTTLVVSFLAIILANRSWHSSIAGSLRNPNPALWWVLGGTVGFLALVLSWPVAQRLFHFAPPGGVDLLLAALAGFASILWYDALKLCRRRARRPAEASGR